MPLIWLSLSLFFANWLQEEGRRACLWTNFSDYRPSYHKFRNQPRDWSHCRWTCCHGKKNGECQGMIYSQPFPRHFPLFLMASCDHHHSCPPVSSSAADVVTGKNMSSRVPATMTIKVSPVIQCCCNLARRKELEAIMQETNVFKK